MLRWQTRGQSSCCVFGSIIIDDARIGQFVASFDSGKLVSHVCSQKWKWLRHVIEKNI